MKFLCQPHFRHLQATSFAGWLLCLCFSALLLLPALASAQIAPQAGDEIRNIGSVNYDIGNQNRTVDTNEVIDTVEVIRNPDANTDGMADFLHHTPGFPTGDLGQSSVAPTQCGAEGAEMVQPIFSATGDEIDFNQPQDLSERENRYNKAAPIFVRVRDLDEDHDLSRPDTVIVTVTSDTGDIERLVLTETGDSTGVFIGAVNTYDINAEGASPVPGQDNDCKLAVSNGSVLTLDYDDENDPDDRDDANNQDTAIVDPFGLVFDSTTGAPVNGAAVRLRRIGGPTEVRGDDGQSAYPDEVLSGDDFTAGGIFYQQPDGGFRFPQVDPGQYVLEVVSVPDGYRLRPSDVSIEDLQALDGAPYTLDENASFGGVFEVFAGPPINIDIPLDPIITPLFVTKTVSDEDAAIGDFIQYELSVTNQSTEDAATRVVLRDILPQGFRVQSGSVRLDGEQFLDPEIGQSPRNISWVIGNLASEQRAVLTYVVAVTAATPLGTATNQVQAETRLGSGVSERIGQLSNIALADVRIEEELFRSTNTIIGRVIIGSCDNDVTNDEIGLGSVRLYMEDGRWVTTDRDGRYHFEGITARPHVVQVDVDTIPDEYEIQNCDNDSRSAGSSYSRFVDAQGGSLWRVDFHVREKIASKGDFTVRLSSQPTRAKAQLEYVDYVVRPRFDTLKADLQPIDKADLASTLAQIGDTRGIRVQVVGHTDSRKILGKGREQFADNYALSRARAQSVVDFVRDRLDLEDWQIVAEGRGADEPVVPNKDEASWAKNRRVVLRVWGDDVILPDEAMNSITFRLDMIARTTSFIDQEKLVVHHDVKSTVILPEGVTFIPGSVTLGGKPYRDPVIRSGGRVITFERGDWIAPRIDELTFRTKVALGISGSERLIAKATARFFTSRQGELNVVPAIENEFIPPVSDATRRARVVLPVALLEGPVALAPADDYLQKLYDEAAGQESGVRIQVVGHSYSDGESVSGAAMEAEARRMAQLVADRVQAQLGIDAGRVSVISMGGNQPFLGAEAGSAGEFNRRVEVTMWVDPRIAEDGLQVVQSRGERVTATEESYVSEVEKEVIPRPSPVTTVYPPEMTDEWFAVQSTELEFVWPTKDYVATSLSSDVGIKYDSRYSLRVTINEGEPERYHFEGTSRGGPNDRVSVNWWRNQQFIEGPNEVLAVLIDPATGQEIARKTHTVHIGARPARAEWVRDRSYTVADGRNKPVMVFRLFDRWGKPSRPGFQGKFSVAPPYRSWQEVLQLRDNPVADSGIVRYKIASDGLAYIELEPTTESGEAIFNFALQQGQNQSIRTFLKSKPRDWIMVGIAEGRVGYNTLKDHSEALPEAGGEDRYITEGRTAFYASGRIKGEWLLTMAYDSSKERLREQRRLQQSIDPDEFYTIYGDETEQGYGASSSDKLYLKLEREQFFAMYGDYQTGMSVTELSRFERSFTGFKSVYAGQRLQVNVFAAQETQSFIRREIQGNGTSGLYDLGSSDILINSDRIRIEVRDRFRSENIVEERILARHIDYNIDYQDGTVFFREPVFSRDADFNQIFIVAEFETFSDGDERLVAGARVGLSSDNERVVVGVSAVMQELQDGDQNLIGLDASWSPTVNTVIRAEVAGTDRTDDSESRDGAYLFEVDHRGGIVTGQAYYRQQDSGFGMGQQNASEGGQRKIGFDAAVRVTPRTILQLEGFQQTDLSSDLTRDFQSAAIARNFESFTVSVGAERATDEVAGGKDRTSTLGFIGANGTVNNGRVGLNARYEGAIDNEDENPDFPSRLILGADFLVGSGTKLFVQQEFTDSATTRTSNTRVGVATSPWSGATTSGSIGQERTENGPRVFSQIGLRQDLAVSERTKVSIGFERSDTIKQAATTNVNPNVPPASGTSSSTTDFTAVTLGVSHNAENWSAATRVEYRGTEKTDKWTWFTSAFTEASDHIAFSMRSRLEYTDLDGDGEDRAADVKFGFVWRKRPSRWTVLDTLELKYDDAVRGGDTVRSSRKAVNNFVINYRHNINTQISVNYGSKYVRQNFDDQVFSGYTDLLGAEIRRDFGFTKGYRPWDFAVHGDVLTSRNDDVSDYGYGVELGRTIARNLRLAVGYNVSGYKDSDLNFDRYRERGPFAAMQFKFDQNTFKGLLRVKEEDSASPRPAEPAGYNPTLKDFD